MLSIFIINTSVLPEPVGPQII